MARPHDKASSSILKLLQPVQPECHPGLQPGWSLPSLPPHLGDSLCTGSPECTGPRYLCRCPHTYLVLHVLQHMHSNVLLTALMIIPCTQTLTIQPHWWEGC